jgi:hypothetical protein
MSKSLASLLSCLLLGAALGALAACEGPGLPEEEGAPLATVTAAQGSDGWPTQGRRLHASVLESVSFSGAELAGQRVLNLRLEKGELVGQVPFVLRATASLSPCAEPTVGVARACGLSVMGVGTCAPGGAVHLGGGGCGLGSCTGDPVVRVCAGAQPCEDAARLAATDDACGTRCPDVTFTCPSTGTYTVLAGPYQSGAAWSVKLVASTGQFPGLREVRGKDLQGARLQGLTTEKPGQPALVYLDAIESAAQVSQDTVGTPWDGSGSTFLYRLRIAHQVGGSQVEVRCEPSLTGPNPNSDWAVPLRGVYEADTGALDTSDTTRFTFGCDNGVIAKCYRWGYKPWLDAPNADAVALTHWACTRMARADYCGSGEANTLDGTHIAFWDRLAPVPTHAQPPQTTLPRELRFEAGWNSAGAVCLSHARWATMPPPPVGCPLVAPSYLVDGGTGVSCAPGEVVDAEEKPCATVCNTPEEAVLYQAHGPVRTLNHSALNGLDGGVP